MITLKLEKSRGNNVVFKINLAEHMESNLLIKRVLYESKPVKSVNGNEYIVPVRFFTPLFNNIDKKLLKIDKNSISCFYQYSDEYDENYYYFFKATPNVMKKWIGLKCPPIYKIHLNIKDKTMDEFVAFEKTNNLCVI